MKVVITGGTGFLGTALTRALSARGDEVVRMTRGAPGAGAAHWDPTAGEIDKNALEGAGAVVHLAGQSIGGRRWNVRHRARVLDSRVRGTRLIAETMTRLDRPPPVLVSSSAVGYYGDRGEETLTEASPPGRGFLAEVCRAWEESTAPAADAGVRVVRIRTGLVLSRAGGILPRSMLPFRFGVGGRLGSGRQWWPWITLEDYVAAVVWCLDQESLSGPANVTAPHPVRNGELAATLGRLMRRPSLVPAPAWALKLALGPEMAKDLLLSSQKVLPAALEAHGFRFAHRFLEGGLRAELSRR